MRDMRKFLLFSVASCLGITASAQMSYSSAPSNEQHSKIDETMIKVFDEVNMPVDEIFLWIEENIPLEYKGKEGCIVAAERNAKPIEGFDYGNSPFHYINADVAGKTLVLTTTNGTKAIYYAKEHKVLTASYINIEAVAQHLIEEHNDVIILCSGWKGVFNLEDPIFAGSLAKLLLETGSYESNCDSLFASMQLLKSADGNLFTYLSDSSHRKRLKSLNMEDDTRFCLSPPVKSDIIPILKDGKLVVL